MDARALVEVESIDATGTADRHPGVSVHTTLSRDRKHLALHSLHAFKDSPKGSGTAYMNDLVAWADRNGVLITLQTGSEMDQPPTSKMKSTSSSGRLKRFYARFGFRSNYARRDYRADLPGNMHRYPNA